MSCNGQVVILIGNAFSADDISRDIAQVAKEVHVASRSVDDRMLGKQPGYDNMWLHSRVKVFSLWYKAIYRIPSRELFDS